MGMEDQMLTVEQVATKLQVHPNTVRRWLTEGLMRGAELGGSKTGWRIRPSEVEKFISDREQAVS